MSFISSTLARFITRYRTVSEWAEIYLRTVQASQVQRKTNGQPPVPESMSWRFEQARNAATQPTKYPPSLHECRSLAARMYFAQGIKDIQTLLGHSSASMTEVYKDDRGLSKQGGVWRKMVL